MSNTFILKESSVPGKEPLTTDLVLGELAVNTYDGRVFLKKDVSGTESIVEVSTQYDNADTQFTSNTVNGVLDEIDDILDTKVVINSDASLIGVLFDTVSPSTSTQIGSTRWSVEDGTIETLLSTETVLQHGQEVFYHVENRTGVTITNGTVVRYTGTIGNSGKMLIEPHDGTSPSRYILGIVTETITTNSVGFVTHFGKTRGINTTGQNGETWSDGDILYASQTIVGGLTNIRPESPGIKMAIAVVINAAIDGVLFVRPTPSSSLNDDELIELGTLNNNDILQYNDVTSRFENTSTPSFSEISIGTDTNNTTIESDGTLVFNGGATVWTDIDFPITIKIDKDGEPKLATLAGNIEVPKWEIDDFMVCEGTEMIHAWKEGSDVHWHCHVITNGTDTTDRYIKFEVEVIRAKIDSQIDTPTIIQSDDFLIPANTPDRTHFFVPIGVQSMTGYTIGTHVYARLHRIDSTTGTAPSEDVFCSMLQMHIQCDTFGSRLIDSK